MRSIRLLIIAFLLPATSFASFVTIYDTHLVVDAGGLGVYQNPQGSDATGYDFNLVGTTLEAWGTFLDEGCTVSIRSYDGSSSTTLAQYGGETYDVGYGLFYFDVSTYGWHPPQQYTATGWALMENSPASGLVMLQSVMTYEAVPEPSSAVLLLVGCCSCWFLRKKFARKQMEIRTST